jgi:hypothetical protein
MLLDRGDEARSLYLQYRDERVDAKQSGEDLILSDFATLRAAGFPHSLMDEIEAQFSEPKPESGHRTLIR